MIIRTRQGDVEVRAKEWGNSSDIPSPGTRFISGTGMMVTEDSALGLPAVSNVIRSPSEVIASLPFMTYTNNPRARAEKTWQWRLLHDEPDDLGTGTYQFFYDLELSLEASQNTFLQKAKSRNKIEALYVIDPQRVRVYRGKDGTKLFDVYNGDGETVRALTSDDILHIRGYTPIPGTVVGVSLIESLRNSIGSMLALQGFEGDYFKNGAVPSFFFTGAKNREHAMELIEMHQSRHRGVGNQFKVGGLWGTADVKPMPLSMQDAQFVESKQMSVEEACRIWRWPKELMELSASSAGQQAHDENAWSARMLKFYILPRVKRIERAFAADKDLFGSSKLVGEFLTAALERADFVTRMRGYKDARQGGWATANEIRDYENLPPREDGDTLLETPTGSAPNTVPASGGQAQEPPAPSKNGKVSADLMTTEQEW